MIFRAVRLGLLRLLRRADAEADLQDEIAHYLELSAREHADSGLSPADAARASRLDFRGVEATKDAVRGAGWDGAIDTLWRDVTYGFRTLHRNAAFTLVAVLTLSLGIGANTAMFSVVNAVMLRPLPYRDANRLVLLWTDDVRRGLHEEGTAFRTISDWRTENRSFHDVAFFSAGRATIADEVSRERTRYAFVSANLFQVLGVTPQRGRAISTDDEAKAEPVVVISNSLWQRRFGGDPNVIGRTLRIEENAKDDELVRIIGVMPPGVYFPDKNTEMWTPATSYWRFQRESRERFPQWARRWTGVARLRADVSPDAARSDLARIGRRLTVAYPSDVEDFPGFAVNVVPVLDHIAGRNLQSALWVLLGAVGLVLLVACANVANLLLARGASRQREFAIRRALGAGRVRLVRQLVVESMVLALAGGAGGLLIAFAGTRLLATAAATRLPRMEEVTMDGRVLFFAAALSIAAGIVFGIVPAFRVSGTDASEALKGGGGHASSGVRLRRTRSVLVVAECSFAIVLLAGAGLLLRSMDRLRAVNPGFDPTRVLTMRIEFPPEASPTAEENTQTSVIAPARARGREQRLHELTARVEAAPGVSAVGFIDDMFVTGQGNKSITIPGRAIDSIAAGELNEGAVTPGFFATLHVPLLRGRYLDRNDIQTKIRALWSLVITDMSLAEKEQRAIAEPVVVNEAFVRRYFPNDDPLGKRFCTDPTNKTYWYVIVGVIGDMHRQGLDRRAIPEYFGTYLPAPTGRAELLVRTHGDPLDAAATIRRVVAATIPNALIVSVSTADRDLGDFSAERRFQTWLLATFALLALSLAAVGIFGVVHYAVAERTREIGVRVALGARPTDLMWLVIGQGMRMPAVGITLGLLGALGMTRLMSHLLFDVGAADPATFATVGVVLAAVAAAACYFPARRATQVDAVRALRAE